MLKKSFPALVKKAGEPDGLPPGQFEAIVSVFGNKDSYGEVVAQGAFADTLAEWEASGDPIPIYWSHRMDDPDYNIGNVLEAKETGEGLWVRGQLDVEDPTGTSKAPQVHRLLKGRRVTQFSFAYDVVEGGMAVRDDGSGEEETYFELRKLRLHEVGPTPIGANRETQLLDAKSALEGAAREAKTGQALTKAEKATLREARDAIDSVLTSRSDSGPGQGEATDEVEQHDQEKATGTAEGKSTASDEESGGAKSSVADEDPKPTPLAEKNTLAADIDLLAYVGGKD